MPNPWDKDSPVNPWEHDAPVATASEEWKAVPGEWDTDPVVARPPTLIDKAKSWVKKKVDESQAEINSKTPLQYATDRALAPFKAVGELTASGLGALPRVGQGLLRAGAGASDVALNPILNATGIDGPPVNLKPEETTTAAINQKYGQNDYAVDSLPGKIGKMGGDVLAGFGKYAVGGIPLIATEAGLNKAGAAKEGGASTGTALTEGIGSASIQAILGSFIPQAKQMGPLGQQVAERLVRGVSLGGLSTVAENFLTKMHNSKQPLTEGLLENIATMLGIEGAGLYTPKAPKGVTREQLKAISPEDRALALEHLDAVERGAEAPPLTPGAATYVAYSTMPGGLPPEEGASGYSKFKESFNKTFNPEALGPEAVQTAGIIREALGRESEAKAVRKQSFGELAKAHQGDTPYDFLSAARRVEEGNMQPDALDTASELTGGKTYQDLRDAQAAQAKQAQGLETGKLAQPFEDYFHRSYEQDGQPGFLGRRPIEGPQSTLKPRTYDTTEEGMLAGNMPDDTNPISTQLKGMDITQKYISGETIKQEMLAKGLALPKADAPTDWVRLQDTSMGESLYAPKGAAQVFNNHVSQGLRGKAPYDAYMAVANAMNQAQLAFPGFHAGFAVSDTTISKSALGLEKVVHGISGKDPQMVAKGFGDLLTTPLAFPEALVKGHNVLKDYKSGSSDPVVKFLVDGGQRFEMTYDHSSQMAQGFKDALKSEQYGKAAIKAPFAAMEQVAKPVMEYLIPRVKAGVAYEMAKMEMARLPKEASTEVRRDVAYKINQSVDNRLGEMNYDNLFMNRMAKDVLHATVRSVGFTGGTALELGGGIKDYVTAGKNILSGNAKDAEFTHRMAYTTALPMMTALAGSIYQYLMTGESPDEKTLAGFPKAGEKNAQGIDQRVSFPTYMNTVEGLQKDAKQTILNKLHPMVGATAQFMGNKDYEGNQIRDTNAPALEQLGQTAKWGAGLFEPIASKNFKKAMTGGATPTQALRSSLGIVNAPASIDKTDAENKLSEIMGAKSAVGGRTISQAERRSSLKSLRSLIQDSREGDETAKDNIMEMIQQGKINTKDIRAISKTFNVSRLSQLSANTKKVDLQGALRVWEVATPEERIGLRPVIANKIKKYRQSRLKDDTVEPLIENWYKDIQ